MSEHLRSLPLLHVVEAQGGGLKGGGLDGGAQAAAMSVHVSKLRGIDQTTRQKLKRHGISYSHQLLERGGRDQDRATLGRQLGLAPEAVDDLLERADLASIRGIGTIFADMLRLVGIRTTGALARERADALHARLKSLNDAERFARRAPTPDEVSDWVEQARALPRRL